MIYDFDSLLLIGVISGGTGVELHCSAHKSHVFRSWDRLHCKMCMFLKTARKIICLGIRLNYIGCGVSF